MTEEQGVIVIRLLRRILWILSNTLRGDLPVEEADV